MVKCKHEDKEGNECQQGSRDAHEIPFSRFFQVISHPLGPDSTYYIEY